MTAAERTIFIGGSEQADLLNIAPYGCARRLWLNKREPIEQDLSDNPHIRRGNLFEPVAAEEYSRLTGRKLRRCGLIREGYRAANLDRHIVAFNERGPGVLEIKCPTDMTCRQYRRDGLPTGYSLQLNWYMDLTGWSWGSFAVLNAADASLLWFDVDYDAGLAALQREKAADMWRMVENGPMPEGQSPDSKACARCVFFDRCHPNETPAEDTGELVQISTPEIASAIADYAAAHEVASEAEALKEEAKAQIKALIGDATAVDAPGARVYHRSSTRETVDSKLLKKQFPEAAQACSKTTTVKALRIYERN